MATRNKKDPTEGDSGSTASAHLASTVRESAQQIWLAGLGAFSKAQEEGGRVFEALVKEGVTLQRRTQQVAEERLSEASSRMTSMASDLSTKASGQWDRLENIFEERVSRALKTLGVPTAPDVHELAARVEELERQVAALGGSRPARGAGAARKVAAKAPAKRSPARKTPR